MKIEKYRKIWIWEYIEQVWKNIEDVGEHCLGSSSLLLSWLHVMSKQGHLQALRQLRFDPELCGQRVLRFNRSQVPGYPSQKVL